MRRAAGQARQRAGGLAEIVARLVRNAASDAVLEQRTTGEHGVRLQGDAEVRRSVADEQDGMAARRMHRGSRAFAGAGGARRRAVGKLEEPLPLAGLDQPVRCEREGREAVAGKDRPAGVVEPVAHHFQVPAERAHGCYEVPEARIDRDGGEMRVQFIAAAVEKLHLAGHAGAGADPFLTPEFLQRLPARTPETTEQLVCDVGWRDRAIEVAYHDPRSSRHGIRLRAASNAAAVARAVLMIRSVEYLFEGGRTGVLLVHGLTGTPSEMRFVAKGLHRAGFTVYGMQLAGHCGQPDDLLTTGWRDWYRSVDDAAIRLRARVDRLFVAGLSMGALLALELAVHRPHVVRGVALYGTTFFYDGWAVPLVARLAFLLPVACALGVGRRRAFMETFPYGIKDPGIRERIVGRMLGGDSAAAGLPGNPWPSLAQLELLARRVRRDLPRMRAPCLALHAAEDDIASVRNVELVRRYAAAPVETVLLQDSYHMITVDRERHVVVDRSVEFFSKLVATEDRGRTDQPCFQIAS